MDYKQLIEQKRATPPALSAADSPPPTGGFSAADISSITSAPSTPTGNLVTQQGSRNFMGSVYDSITSAGPGAAVKLIGQAGEAVSKEGSDGSMGSFGASALDWFSMGTADNIAAFDHAAREYGRGKNFSKAYVDRKEDINYGLAENREAHPVATTIGSIAGGVGSGLLLGGPVVSGLKAIGLNLGKSGLSRALVVAPMSAAGEAALYRYNSDGTREEIMQDAAFAALGGALFGSLTTAGGGLVRRIKGQAHLGFYEQKAAKEMLDAVRINNAKMGVDADVIPDEIMQRMNRDGAKAVIADVYPEMVPMMAGAFTDDLDSIGKARVVNLMRVRNLAEEDFSRAITDAVEVPRLRSPQEFKQHTAAKFRALSPRYDAILDGLEQRGVSIKPSNLIKSFDETVASRTDADTQYMKEARDFLVNQLSKGQRVVDGARQDEISARALHNAKVAFGQQMNRNKSTNRGLNVAYTMFDEVLSSLDPHYAKLTNTYKTAAAQQSAFDSGYNMFRKTNTSPADMEQFINNASSYGEFNAFTQGVRRKLYEDLKEKRTPASVANYLQQNRRRMDNLAAVFGKDKANAMIDSVMDAVSREQTNRKLSTAISREVANPGNAGIGSARAGVTDVALAARGSPAVQVRALGRLTGLGAPSAAQRSATTDIYSAGAQPIGDLPNVLRQLQGLSQGKIRQAAPDLGARALGVGGAVAGGMSGAADAVEAQNIMDYLSGL